MLGVCALVRLQDLVGYHLDDAVSRARTGRVDGLHGRGAFAGRVGSFDGTPRAGDGGEETPLAAQQA